MDFGITCTVQLEVGRGAAGPEVDPEAGNRVAGKACRCAEPDRRP